MPSKISSRALGGILARLRSLREGATRRAQLEAEMSEEFATHIALRAADLEAEGLDEKAARRQAKVEFGWAETHKANAREARGLHRLDQIRFSWLDVKAGARLLVKTPGITLVAVFALAIGIPVGLAPSHLASVVEAPIPEDTEDRIRSLRYWNRSSRLLVGPTAWELERWRGQLGSFEALGAFRSGLYNVAPGGNDEDGRYESFLGAEVTATTFRILGVTPALGRALVAADEVPGTAPVVVLGYRLWETRFGASRDALGSPVDVGGVPHTVVGVMPESFRFPVQHQLWLPLRDQVPAEPAIGRELSIFGLRARGVSDQEAHAELAAAGRVLTNEYPKSHEHLEPEVVPFALGSLNLSRAGLDAEPGFLFFQGLGLVLLLVACANVAMLVFARAATRSRELAVRGALGASRARVISQLFAESLVLVGVASLLGLAVVEWALTRIFSYAISAGAALPYWLDLGVSWGVVLWTVGLGALSAVVAGVAPGWRVTRAQLGAHLASVGSGASSLRFGRLSGALIVTDVAIAVVVIVVAAGLSGQLADAWRAEDVAIPAEEFLVAGVRLPSLPSERTVEGSGDLARRAALHTELLVRLRAEPGARAATLATALPRMDHPARRVEIEGFTAQPRETDDESAWHRARVASVDVDYFGALDQPVLVGRSFALSDLEDPKPVVAVVDELFVEQILGGLNPVGRRLRFLPREWSVHDPATESEWIDVIGVVPAMGLHLVRPQGDPGVYLPAAPGTLHPMRVAVQTHGAPDAFTPRLREVLRELEPAALLVDPRPLDRVVQRDWYFLAAVGGGFFLLVGVLVALAASAIFAMITFSVAQRTREIGLRNALGASRRAIVSLVLRRTLIQLLLGTVLGLPLAFMIARQGFAVTDWGLIGVTSAGLSIMVVTGLIACTAPTLRALRIEPTRALRAE